MERLLENILPDEEIIVIDGASNDGTVSYLQGLYNSGKIHSFLSEPDVCQAHGTNKGMLMARGELIKIITDDDAYYYPAIHQCKEFMLTHQDVDIVSSDIADTRLDSLSQVYVRIYTRNNFTDWLQNHKPPFWFGDQGLMIRRNQLPLIGLWHTGVICIDVELSVRLTALCQVNLAWYTGIVSLTLANPDSNGVRYSGTNRNLIDVRKTRRFYSPNQSPQSIVLSSIRMRLIRMLKKSIRIDPYPKSQLTMPKDKFQLHKNINSPSIPAAFKYCDQWLKWYDSEYHCEFIFKNK